MAKQQRDHKWLNAKDFGKINPLHAVITDIWIEKKARGDETVIEFLAEGQLRVCMSIWGNNKNVLIDKFGDEDSLWIGKHITIFQEKQNDGSCFRTITPQ